MKKKLSRVLLWALIAAGVLLLLLIVRTIFRYMPYHKVSKAAVRRIDTGEIGSCSNLGGRVLRVADDSVMLLDDDLKTRWEFRIRMNEPETAVSGDTAVVYDQGGTSVAVCGTGGKTGSFTTKLPIIKATVSGQGNVAVILKESAGAWIRYYTKSGREIAVIRTTLHSPGYPMDLALSPDGLHLAVTYLSYTDSRWISRVRYYGFGKDGQDKKDNQLRSLTEAGVLIPQVIYPNDEDSVLFREDGFAIMSGQSRPSLKKKVKISGKIQKVFYSDRYIGFILDNGSIRNPVKILVYDLEGKRILSAVTDFTCDRAEFSGNEISLFNGGELCVYDMQGHRRYRGGAVAFGGTVFSQGMRRYVQTNENGITRFYLKW